MISVLEPATTTLPASVQKISILPLPGIPAKPGIFDSLHFIKPRAGANIRDIKMGYLHGIYDVMSSSPRFRKVVLSDTSDIKTISKGYLYWNDIERICSHDSTDVLLVLNKAVSYDIWEPSTYLKDYYDGYYVLLSHTIWSIYLPEEQQILTRFKFSDTLMMTGDFSNLEFNGLLYDACYASGKRAGTKLCPHWNDTAKRYFYLGPGKDLKTAARFVRKNQWYDAALIWNKLAEGEKNKKASRAAFNLALAYERDDILDQAALWVTFSDSLFNNTKTSAYKKTLEDRLKTRIKLYEQMAGY
jgi:hypothetical protein